MRDAGYHNHVVFEYDNGKPVWHERKL
jgi:hypothetical protein